MRHTGLVALVALLPCPAQPINTPEEDSEAGEEDPHPDGRTPIEEFHVDHLALTGMEVRPPNYN